MTSDVTTDNVAAVLQQAQDDALEASMQPLTDAELDAWEADTLARGEADRWWPKGITLAIIDAERARRARHVNLVHALAGHPLGRSSEPHRCSTCGLPDGPDYGDPHECPPGFLS